MVEYFVTEGLLLQEEVVERAKKAKEKAALEALEDKGLVSSSLASRPDSTSPDSTTPLALSYSGPTSEDTLQEMLKD